MRHLRRLRTMGGDVLVGKRDHYEGIRVRASENAAVEGEELKERLQSSLAEWRKEGVRGCWLEINLAQSEWVPTAAAQGFTFHHARDDEVVMVAWLQPDQPNQLPRYPFTQVGVGGIVRDPQGRVLMMREKRGRYLGWKFPGGLLDPREDLEVGCGREVEEETGVKVEMKGVLTWRHSHQIAFKDCSDLYFLLVGEPVGPGPWEPQACTLEAADARWFTKDEILSMDTSKNVSILTIWALELAEKYAEAGFPDGVTKHNYDHFLARFGRKWNAHHLPLPLPSLSLPSSI